MDEIDRVCVVYAELGVQPDIGYVYILKAANNLYKIGKTKSPNIRIGAIRTSSPVEVEVHRVFKSSQYNDAERSLHELYAGFRVIGEWFALGPDQLDEIDAASGDHVLLPCYT